MQLSHKFQLITPETWQIFPLLLTLNVQAAARRQSFERLFWANNRMGKWKI